MQPLVSVLIPAYNAEAFVGQAIESALAQTWDRIEILVADDGSMDRTYDVARCYESDAVQILRHSNRGAAATRNVLLSKCQGDYIQWLDADDLLAPEKIERQLSAAEKDACQHVLYSGAWGHFLHRIGKARFRPTKLWQDATPCEWMLRKMETGAHMQPATWLVSRQLTELAGPWDTRLRGDDDGEYFARVVFASRAVRFVEEARIFYRMTGAGSLSYVGDSDRKLEAQLLSCRLNVQHVMQKCESDRARRACGVYLNRYAAMFYVRRPDLMIDLEQLAESVGQTVQRPQLPGKYRWLEALLGWIRANRLIRFYNEVKWGALSFLDYALWKREQVRKPTAAQS